MQSRCRNEGLLGQTTAVFGHTLHPPNRKAHLIDGIGRHIFRVFDAALLRLEPLLPWKQINKTLFFR